MGRRLFPAAGMFLALLVLSMGCAQEAAEPAAPGTGELPEPAPNGGPSAAPQADSGETPPATDLGELTITEEQCVQEGGELISVPGIEERVCAHATQDGGTECTDSGQCTGICVADINASARIELKIGKIAEIDAKGYCDYWTEPLGCVAEVAGGKASAVRGC